MKYTKATKGCCRMLLVLVVKDIFRFVGLSAAVTH